MNPAQCTDGVYRTVQLKPLSLYEPMQPKTFHKSFKKSPGQSGSVAEVPACTRKGCRVNSRPRAGTWVASSLPTSSGHMWEATGQCVSPISLFLSFPSLSPAAGPQASADLHAAGGRWHLLGAVETNSGTHRTSGITTFSEKSMEKTSSCED